MKTERRHQLQTNQLADQLGKTIESTKPYLKWIGIGVAAAIVLVLTVTFISHRQNVATGNAWAEYIQALSETDRQLALQDVATVYPGTAAATWAELAKADLNLGQGCQSIYQNKEEAEKLLNEAIEGYKSIVGSSPRDTFTAQRAQFGLGTAYETLGRLKEAREAYEEVLKRGETTAVARLAKEHLDLLKSDEVQAFYDWFVAQKSMPTGPGSGLPNLPGDLGELPDFPDLSIPGVATPPLTFPGSDGATTPPPAATDPATPPPTATDPAAPPATTDPATPPPADKPADDKPAAEQPAPEKPAEEKPPAPPEGPAAPGGDAPAPAQPE